MKKSKIITAIGNHLAREEEPIILNIFYLKETRLSFGIYVKIAEPLVMSFGKIRRSLR